MLEDGGMGRPDDPIVRTGPAAVVRPFFGLRTRDAVIGRAEPEDIDAIRFAFGTRPGNLRACRQTCLDCAQNGCRPIAVGRFRIA
jgi:hypothetical protein